MTQLNFCYIFKKIKITLLLMVISWMSSNLLHAQNTGFYPEIFLENSTSIQKKGMVVLGSWAALNIISGVHGSFAFGKDMKYFHQMNAMWNVVNLSIATFGYLNTLNAKDITSTNEILSELRKFDRILLVNAGLDIVYIGTGILLWNKGLKTPSNRLKGYGKSVVLQGSFLLLFDSILYLIHHQETKEISMFGEKLGFLGNGFRFTF